MNRIRTKGQPENSSKTPQGEGWADLGGMCRSLKSVVVSGIGYRYRNIFRKELSPEKEWIKELLDILKDESEKWRGRNSYIHIDQMATTLENVHKAF